MNALRKFLIVGCIAAFLAFGSIPSAEAGQGYRSYGMAGRGGYYGGGLYQRGYGRDYYGPGNWNRGFVGPRNGFYGPGFGIRF